MAGCGHWNKNSLIAKSHNFSRYKKMIHGEDEAFNSLIVNGTGPTASGTIVSMEICEIIIGQCMFLADMQGTNTGNGAARKTPITSDGQLRIQRKETHEVERGLLLCHATEKWMRFDCLCKQKP